MGAASHQGSGRGPSRRVAGRRTETSPLDARYGRRQAAAITGADPGGHPGRGAQGDAGGRGRGGHQARPLGAGGGRFRWRLAGGRRPGASPAGRGSTLPGVRSWPGWQPWPASSPGRQSAGTAPFPFLRRQRPARGRRTCPRRHRRDRPAPGGMVPRPSPGVLPTGRLAARGRPYGAGLTFTYSDAVTKLPAGSVHV